ncbi:hypothetical protein ACFX2C_028225 [Malus domestica]
MLERKSHLTFNTQIDRSVASVDTMKTYFIGSVLSGGGSAPLPEASAEDWVNMIVDAQNRRSWRVNMIVNNTRCIVVQPKVWAMSTLIVFI